MTNHTAGIESSCVAGRWQNEHGIAALLVIYGLSVFSVLALTMVNNREIERAFRTESSVADLHLVLFGGQTPSDKFIARVNVPTVRTAGAKDDLGIELQLPVPASVGWDREFGPGATYALKLSANVRVCCDTGDNACANQPPDAELPNASVNQPIAAADMGESSNLQFDLSTLPTADNLALDPAVAAGDHFLVKAAKNPSGERVAPGADGLTCSIEQNGKTIAAGTLDLQRKTPTRQSGPFMGKLQLKYGIPKNDASRSNSK